MLKGIHSKYPWNYYFRSRMSQVILLGKGEATPLLFNYSLESNNVHSDMINK